MPSAGRQLRTQSRPKILEELSYPCKKDVHSLRLLEFILWPPSEHTRRMDERNSTLRLELSDIDDGPSSELPEASFSEGSS
jgi:hypothetical protein